MNLYTAIKQQFFLEFPIEGFKRYVSHTGWNLFARISALVISFLVSIYVIRSFGPEQYGLISYVVSFVAIFNIFSNFGIDSVLYINLANDTKDKNRILGTAFFLKLIGVSMTFLFLMIYVVFSSETTMLKVLLVIYSFSLLSAPFLVINAFFQAQAFSKPVALNYLVISLFLSLLKVLVVFLNLDLRFFVGVFAIEALLYIIGYMYIYRKYGHSIRAWTFDKSYAKELLYISWPLMFSNASILVYSRVDQVMIGKMINTASVGLYDAAVRVAEIWYFFPPIVIASLFPAVINAKKTDPKLYARRVTQLYVFAFYSSLCFIVPLSFFAHPIVSMLYGEEYLSSASVLSIYIWAGLWVSLGTMVLQVLIDEKQTKIIFLSHFFAMLLNVSLNFVLIPLYQITGAAIATAISYMFIPATVLFFKQTRRQGVYIIKGIFFKMN
jgi:O-antigen/teichoic acid export membrane protein